MARRFDGLDRRTFLKAMGLGAAAVPLLPSLNSFAQAGSIPKRFIVFFTPNGTILDAWKPTGTETNFQFGEILQPLNSYKDDLLILQGLNMNSTKSGPGDGHMKGMGHLLTGDDLERYGPNGEEFKCAGKTPCAGFAGGKSIDQLIADESAPADIKAKSLTLGVQTKGANVWTRMVYRGPNRYVDPIDNPMDVYTSLFPAGFAPDDPNAKRLIASRRSILDYANSRYKALKQRIDSQDIPAVDAHLEGIRAIERRLAANSNTGCSRPDAPATIDHNKSSNFPAVGKLQMDMMVAALRCDLTRVATLQWSRSVSGTVHSWAGTKSSGHHSMSHDSAKHKSDLIKINRWYAEQFAYLVGQLKSIPEGNGTLLDNTVILWGNELADGDRHTRNDMPFVLAGNAGGYFKTGRHLKYNGDHHNNLLVSIANAMGVPITTFGNREYSDGPLPNLT